VAIVTLIVIPDHRWWPSSLLFNRHPIQWLPALKPDAADDKDAKPSLLGQAAAWLGLGGGASHPPSPVPKKLLREKGRRKNK